MICRNCGCTDDHACPLGCYWVAPEVCSSCAAWVPPAPYDVPAGTKVVDCIAGPHVFVRGLTVLVVAYPDGARPTKTEQQVALWNAKVGRPAANVVQQPAVRLWNPKTARWEDWAYVDSFGVCPVDRMPMRIFAVRRGTTWPACCSEGCCAAYLAAHPEMQIKSRK